MKIFRDGRGFTLAELSIVILMIGLMAVSIITFTSALHGHIGNYNVILDTADDVTFCRKTMVAWVSHFDKEGFEIRASFEKLTATDLESGDNYELYLHQVFDEDGSFVENVLLAQYDNGKVATYKTKNVLSASFSEDGGRMFKCYLLCKTAGAGADRNERHEGYNFLVARKVTE